jgi:hypothetical protein
MAKQTKTSSQPAPEVPGVNLSEIESLLHFMEKHGLEEFEYQRGDLHIRLRKAAAGGGSYRTVGTGAGWSGGGRRSEGEG